MLTATEDYDLRGYYAGRVNMRDPPVAALYGQALAYVQRGHPAEAIPILQPLVTAHQGVIMLHSLLAQAQIAARACARGLGDLRARRDAVPRAIFRSPCAMPRR